VRHPLVYVHHRSQPRHWICRSVGSDATRGDSWPTRWSLKRLWIRAAIGLALLARSGSASSGCFREPDLLGAEAVHADLALVDGGLRWRRSACRVGRTSSLGITRRR
jgi:hypothetical protein